MDELFSSVLSVAGSVVVPASAEGFVKCYDSQELIALGARQIELCREELLLGFEDLVITGFAGSVTFRGEFDGGFQGSYLPRALLANLLKSLARGKGVGNVAQGGERGLPIVKQGFVPDSVCLAVLSDQSASFKQRPAPAGSDGPCIGAAKRKS